MYGGKNLPLVIMTAWMLIAGCTDTGSTTLEIGFARQAQTSAPGLPEQVASLEVEVHQGTWDGELLGRSGCVVIGGDQRQRLMLDLVAGKGLVLVVKAWENKNCTPVDQPPWSGASLKVDIPEGERTTVPVFVTRRGWHRNFARQELIPPVAFASATRLKDGRVLLAGGLEAIEETTDGWRLIAGNRAWIYHPGTGRMEAVGRLSEGRAAHRAFLLTDGRVVLIGGAREALLYFSPQGRFQLIQEGAPAGMDIFHPENDRFSFSYLPRDLERTEAAWATDGMGKVYALGGKTALARTDEVWLGEPASDYFQWMLRDERLSVARRGAQALVLDDRILVAGGARSGQAGLEMAELATLTFEPMTGTEAYASLVGSTLDKFGTGQAWLCGGIAAEGVEEPVSFVLQLRREPDGFSQQLGKLLQARAYHQSQLTAEGLVLVGGVSEGFAWLDQLEVHGFDGGEFVLEDRLSCASLGVATAELEDGSLLTAGGIGLDENGRPKLCSTVEIFSP